jgi:hypothetical protein
LNLLQRLDTMLQLLCDLVLQHDHTIQVTFRLQYIHDILDGFRGSNVRQTIVVGKR